MAFRLTLERCTEKKECYSETRGYRTKRTGGVSRTTGKAVYEFGWTVGGRARKRRQNGDSKNRRRIGKSLIRRLASPSDRCSISVMDPSSRRSYDPTLPS